MVFVKEVSGSTQADGAEARNMDVQFRWRRTLAGCGDTHHTV